MPRHEPGRRDDGVPRFDRAARGWFRRWIERDLVSRLGFPPDSPWIRHRVDWYVQHRETWGFAVWQDSEEYRGRSYINGAWVIRWNRVRDARVAREATTYANERASAELDAERYPTLDAWLEAERAGKLRFGGVPERAGAGLLPVEQGTRLREAARARRRRWQRGCRDCGESFTPDHPKAVRCPTCRPTARRPKRSCAAKAPSRAPAGPPTSPPVPARPDSLAGASAEFLAGYRDAMAPLAEKVQRVSQLLTENERMLRERAATLEEPRDPEQGQE